MPSARRFSNIPKTRGNKPCNSPGCRNKARHQRKKCNTCRAIAYDQRHTLHRNWRNLYVHAASRRIPCDLSLEEFREIVGDLPYGGWDADAITLDRLHAGKGYTAGNVGLKTRSGNSVKAASEMGYHQWQRHLAARGIEKYSTPAGQPF